MGVFDNNISKPLSITTIGKDIKESCVRYLKEKVRLYNKYGYGIPSSVDLEIDLKGAIQTKFQQRLEDTGVTLWKVSVIKRAFFTSPGNAHISFYIVFHWWDVYNECRKLFDCEYEII